MNKAPKKYTSLKILIVDDNAVNRLVATTLLNAIGCQVEEASGGKEALEKTARQYYDLIFMDLNMPEMDGFETSQLIRSQEQELKRQPTFIVAISANSAYLDLGRYRLVGMNQHLMKPLSLDKLMYFMECHFETESDNASAIAVSNAITPSRPAEAENNHKTSNNFTTVSSDNSDNCRILLVEDNQVNCIVATSMLEALGCKVMVAENGQRAITLCQQQTYDLIFMDIQMPVMDGIAATARIRQMENYQKVPIIALTANTQMDDLKAYYEVGMNDCIAKPITVERLRSILTRFSLGTVANSTTASAPIPSAFEKITAPNLANSNSATTAPRVSSETSHANQASLSETLVSFDKAHALRLALNNMALLQRLLKEFSKNVEIDIGKLQSAASARDKITLERLSHNLKGSSRSVGALRLGGLAAECEMAVRMGDFSLAEEIVKKIAQEFSELVKIWEQPL